MKRLIMLCLFLTFGLGTYAQNAQTTNHKYKLEITGPKNQKQTVTVQGPKAELMPCCGKVVDLGNPKRTTLGTFPVYWYVIGRDGGVIRHGSFPYHFHDGDTFGEIINEIISLVMDL